MIQTGFKKNSARWGGGLYKVIGVVTSAVASLALILSVSVFALPPSTPTNLQATAGFNEVDLAWTAPDDDGGSPIVDYIIEYSIGGVGEWTPFDDGESADTEATVTGLTVDTEYDFRVSAINEELETSEPSIAASATVLDPAPGAPTALQATATGAGAVSLSWTAPGWIGSSDIIDYIIEYRLSSEGGWTIFSEGTLTDTTSVVTGLDNGVSYDFQVFAVNDTHTSVASTTQSASPFTVPDAPTGISAVRGNRQVTVSFDAPAFNGGSAITGYTVTSSPGDITANGASSPITVTGLDNGTEYTFTVVAINVAGDSVASSASNGVTPATAPGAPTGVSGEPEDRQVSVSFTAPGDDGGSPVTGYTVTSNPGGITASGSSSPIVVTGLENGTTYSFTVTATNDVGEGAPSAASGDVTPRTAPGAPTGVSAVRGDTQATVSFTAPADNGGATITNYTVTSSPDGVTATGSSSPITVTGLTNGTPYTFTVVATNVAGDSAPSGASSSVVPATTPGVPADLSVTGGNKQAILDWNAPSANGEPITSYVVEYSVAGSETWQEFGDGTLSDTEVTVTGLSDGTEYDFRVAAVNAVGQGEFATTSASTFSVPGSPTGVSGTPGNGQVSVSFNAPALNGGSAVTGYTVTASPGGASETGTSSPIVVTGLANGTIYTFTVTATNAIGTSSPSSPSSGVTPRTAPGAPTGLSATPQNERVALSWAAPVSNGGSAITDYIVEYKASADSTWVTFADGTSAGTSATVTDLANGTDYDFRVAAVNVAGPGSYSSVSSATPHTNPGAPTGASAVRGNTQATVSFAAPADDGGAPITNYTVTSDPGNITATGSSSPITVTGLTNGTEYTFTVVATSAAGDSLPSATSNSVTPATIPGAPTAVSGTPGNGQVSVSFTAPASDGGLGITGYTATSTPGGFTGTGSGSPITVNGLQNGISYTFTVTATNDVGSGPASVASSSVIPRTTPGAPTDVVADAGNEEATVSFTAPASNGGATITNYTVTSNPGNITANGASSPVVVDGLTNGTAYTFTVVATNAAGDGSASNASNSVTPAAVPDAPSNLVATPGSTQIALSWDEPNDNGSDITDYIIRYKASADSTWLAFEDDVSVVTSTTITGLTNGTQYDFIVAAESTVGTGSFSDTVSSTPRTSPGAPVGLGVTPQNNQVELSWDSPASNGGAAITDYVVEYRESSESDWLVFADATSPATSATVAGLTNGTQYDFRVAAVNEAGAGSYSTPASSTPRTTPGIPASVSATRGDTQATVSFTAPESNGGSAITSYTVTSNPGGITASGTDSPIIVTGLTNGTPYTFTVIATNAAGDSDASDASGSVTPATVPDAPANVSALAGNGEATVSFTAPAEDGGTTITSYTVTSSPGGITANGSSSPITVSGLTNGTSYTFTVIANNDVGPSASSDASESITPYTKPDAPINVSAEAGNTEATITFSAPAFNGGSAITNYKVISSPGNIEADGSTSPITVTGLTNGTAYTFTVIATNAAGDSNPSTASNSATPAAVPDAPSGLIATPGSMQVGLVWEAPNNNGSNIIDYIVQYKPTADSTWTTFVDGTSTTTSVIVTGLTNGTQYDLRVAALSEVGTGSYSSTATSTPRTIPSAPTDITVTPGHEQIELAWAAPSSNGGSSIIDYVVQYKESSEDSWTIFSDGTATVLSATVTGLTNGTSYDFRIAAVNVAGTGPYSTSGSSTPYTTPAPPTNLTATRGNTEATIAFTAPSSNGGSAITGYTVTSNPGNITASGSSSPITITGLSNGTAYTFTVIATNAAGDSDPSTASNSVTPATVPGAPTGVLTSAGVSQVELSWVTPASSGGLDITDYVIEYKISTDSTWTTFADGTSLDTSVIVTGLTNGAIYDFRIAAVNEVGPGAFSTTVSSVPRTVPGSPTGLQAAAGNARVALSWTAPASNGGSAITDYIVEYSLSGEDDWTTFAEGTSDSTNATVTGLTNETEYDFRVTAVNVAGVGVASATVAATPDLTYTVISNIKTISTANSLTITWKTDVPSDSKVEYGPDTSYGNITTVSQTEGVTDHSVTITNLASCVTYSFRVISQPVTDGGFTTSENNVASTAGCAGDTMVIDEEVAAVPKDDGGIVTLAEGDRSLTVDIPAGYTDSDTVIQLKKLSEAPTNTTGVPTSGLVAVAGQVYEIKAVLSDGTLVTEFDQPITITVQYTDSDVADIDESSLSIYNWHDGAWVALTDCAVDQDVNTVTCTTTSFSLFVLFGEAVVVDKEEDDDEAEDKGSDSDIDRTTDADQKDSGSGSGTTSPPVVTPTDDADGEEDADTETPGEQTRDDEQEDEAEDNSNGIFTWLWIAGAAVAIAIIVALSIKRQRRNAQWQ